MAITFRPLTSHFGAEVIGVDPTLQLNDADFRTVEDGWYRHSILLFRGMTMTPAQHIAVTRRLGPLHIMTPLQYNHPEHPEIFVVANAEKDGQPFGMRRVGLGFHTDGEDKVLPNAGSFLHSKQVPDEGGDTIWSDLYAAWDALPAATQKMLIGRRARFSRIDLHHVHYPYEPALTEQQKRDRPDVWHPIARRHPRSGRTALYIGRWAVDIEGMPHEEGNKIIRELQALTREERFQYRHSWRLGDAMLWDNRCTLHCATGFDDSKYVRMMFRTTLEGEPPIMAAA
ncbi:MAG: TauD/TfdA family dioxygenase [Alphaproteobacteria bacterium]|nr:TauD/TfdA family dioxygenase [Alphaproteobacteria bacterium]